VPGVWRHKNRIFTGQEGESGKISDLGVVIYWGVLPHKFLEVISSMPYRIKVLETGVVEIVHTGSLTIREATQSRLEAGKIMKKQGLRHVLADVSRTAYQQTTMDMMDFNSSHYEVYPLGSRLAVIVSPDPEKVASARFSETVAINRGIAMRIFLKYDDGLTWLTQNQIKQGPSRWA
jgi:hypothetical protein